MDENGLGLADAIGSISGLIFNGGVPPTVKVDDVCRPRQVQPCATRLQRKNEIRGAFFLLELVHKPLTLTDGCLPVKDKSLPPKNMCQVRKEGWNNLSELRKNKNFFLFCGNFIIPTARKPAPLGAGGSAASICLNRFPMKHILLKYETDSSPQTDCGPRRRCLAS